MRTLVFSIEELPLVIADGIPGAFINGQAEILYKSSGDWWIESVSVEGFGDRVDGRRQWPMIPAPRELVTIICQRLEGEWHDKVQTAVIEQLEEDRQCAADDYADMRRDERRLEDLR